MSSRSGMKIEDLPDIKPSADPQQPAAMLALRVLVRKVTFTSQMNKKYLTTDQDSTMGGEVGNEKLNILILIWNLNFCQFVFWYFILGVTAFKADFLNVSIRGRGR